MLARMKAQVSPRYCLLLAGSGLWILLIFAAPGILSENRAVGRAIYLFFSSVCHQRPERCFLFLGEPLAVCARCLGLYLGFFFGLLGSVLLPGFKRLLLAHPRSILFFFLPMAIDVLLPNTHWSRLITGMGASFPVAFLVHQAVEQVRIKSIRSIFS